MTSHAENYGTIPCTLYSGIENYGDGAGLKLKNASISVQPLGLNLGLSVPIQFNKLRKLSSLIASSSVPYYFRIRETPDAKELKSVLGLKELPDIEHLPREDEEFELEVVVKIRRRVKNGIT